MKISKVNVKKSSKTVNNNIQNNLSSTISYPNIQAAKVSDISKSASQTESEGWLDDIVKFLGIDTPTIDIGHDLLKENDIYYKKKDIISVEKRGANSENIVVITNDGNEFLFTPDGNEFVLSSIKLSDGTKIFLDLSEIQQENIRNFGDINSDIPIKGYTNIEVNGEETKVYWVGDDIDFKTFLERLQTVKEGLSNYSSEILNYVFNNSSFNGLFVGTFDSIDLFDSVNDDTVIGFAPLDEYIYINASHDASIEPAFIEHEFAHVLDSCLYDGNGYYTEHEKNINSLYYKYKKTIQQITDVGYPSSMYPNGLPSVVEFFAQASYLYLDKPEELQSLIGLSVNYKLAVSKL